MKSYPNHVNYNGKRYDINTDYRVALKCFNVIQDASISDLERSQALIYLLFGIIPKDIETSRYLLQMCGKYLRCGVDEVEQEVRKQDMDFEQDSGFIYASFISDYGIDIDKVELHWWKFIDLLQGLTDKCVLSRVREIRNYDLSEIKDAKFRKEMIKAKKDLAIKTNHTKEEQEQIDRFEKLLRGG